MPSDHLRAKGLASQNACVGVATALTAFSFIIVSLRLYTRTIKVRNIGKDDFTMLFALLLTIAYLVAIYMMKANGLGFSGKLLNPKQMVNQVQITLAIQITYFLLINSIKISILFFYLRIATRKRFEILVKGTIYFLLTFGILCVILCLLQCIPLHKMWDFTGNAPGKCVNTTALFYTTSSINIAIDIWILLLPISTLLKVQRPRRDKAALVGIFSLGIFSCIASIVRLHAIRLYTQSQDPFFDSVPINLWSMVEVNVGIYCASIPALKALFSKKQRDRSQGYSYGQSERSGKREEWGSADVDVVVHREWYALGSRERPQNWIEDDSDLERERERERERQRRERRDAWIG